MNVLMRVACIVVLVTVGCAGASPTVGIQDRSSYPSWFWQLPEADVAVGVASYGTYEDSTLREAVADAARNLARRERVVIAGGRGEILHVGGATLFADFEETYSTERATAFADPENVLAVARSGTMVVVLLASRSPTDAEKARYGVDPVGAPDSIPGWIASPPIRDGYLYAVGASSPAEYEPSAWRVAESNARKSLALHQYARVRQLTDEGRISLADVEQVALFDYRIVKRWRDPKDGGCFVLGRVQLRLEMAAPTTDVGGPQ